MRSRARETIASRTVWCELTGLAAAVQSASFPIEESTDTFSALDDGASRWRVSIVAPRQNSNLPATGPSARRINAMRTQYFTATSLDGFIATEDDSLDWLDSLGDLNLSSYPEFIAEVGALAMGSTTYEWMMRNSDKVIETVGSAWP